jgi:DNA-binding LacI/PurR family transcriptional regulator
VKKNEGVTLDDIASVSGVSKATVSRVLNNSAYVAEDTRGKVEKAINDLDYKRPSANVKWSLNYDEITIVAEKNITTSANFFGGIFSLVEEHAREMGVTIRLVKVGKNLIQLKRKVSNSKAIIVLGVDRIEILDIIRKQSVPCVIINGIDVKQQISSIAPDYYWGSYNAAKLLIRNGHSKIKLITSNVNHTTLLRQDGFIKACSEHNISTNDAIVDLALYSPELGEFSTDFGAGELLPGLIDQGILSDCTGVVCMCDMIAISLTDVLDDKGVLIPDDLSIVGFDNIDASRFNSPPLTTVSSDLDDLCAITLSTLLQISNRPNSNSVRVSIATSVVERGSVKDISQK